MKKFALIFLIITTAWITVDAQSKIPPTDTLSKRTDTIGIVKKDSTIKKKAPKPYKEVITKNAISRKGLLIVHKVESNWFFEIPDSLLGKDLLIVNRIAKAPIDNHPDDRNPVGGSMIGYAGDIINKTLVRMEKGPEYKIFFRAVSYSVNPRDSTGDMYQSVMNSNVQPIINVLDISAYGQDSTSVVVDVTELLKKDERLFTFGVDFKKAMELGGQQNDRTYIIDIKSFPLNTEIKVARTYERKPTAIQNVGVPQMDPSYVVSESALVSTLEINTSIILLPKIPMRPRYYDERVGFFATGYADYDSDPQGSKVTYMATRWQLEPREEDIEKYKRGELVEPKKPIVYYIDPATPKKWIPYLIQGVNDWQKAFEKAGFKNAIVGKVAPTWEQDSTWSLEDARNSAIVYKPSSIPNASGPHINDPRSGEIIESHINWYHDVMKLLRNWYLVQAGATDTAARHATFSDSLMGTLIRFVSSHEVGHTLGLRHNMGASNATPVEKLRDKAWVEKYGHTASIMDYARFNYVAQPQDSIGSAGIFPRINDYDLWAIEWGYKYLGYKTKDEEKTIVTDLVSKRTENPRLRFISGEVGINDPRSQTEDLGDNAMKASTYGIKNLKYVLPNLPNWVNEKEEDYENLANLYSQVITQYVTYVMHVIKNLGGVYYNPKITAQRGDVFEVTPRNVQKEAMSFVIKQALQKPEWLFDKKLLNKILTPEREFMTILNDYFFNQLFDKKRLFTLISAQDRAVSVYRIEEYLQDIHNAVWSELLNGKPVSSYRRIVQNTYIKKLSELLRTSGILKELGNFLPVNNPYDVTKTDLPAISRSLLRSLKAQINRTLPKVTDKMTRIHLEQARDMISEELLISKK